MWCVPRTSWGGKTFFLARCDGSNWPISLYWRTMCEWGATQHPLYKKFSHWPSALETLQVNFWVPQHLVSMNCLSCRREEVWSPNPCCKLQDSQICLASWICRWGHGSSGSPSSAQQRHLGAADPQCLPGFLPVIGVTRHRSRGIEPVFQREFIHLGETDVVCFHLIIAF